MHGRTGVVSQGPRASRDVRDFREQPVGSSVLNYSRDRGLNGLTFLGSLL